MSSGKYHDFGGKCWDSTEHRHEHFIKFYLTLKRKGETPLIVPLYCNFNYYASFLLLTWAHNHSEETNIGNSQNCQSHQNNILVLGLEIKAILLVLSNVKATWSLFLFNPEAHEACKWRACVSSTAMWFLFRQSKTLSCQAAAPVKQSAFEFTPVNFQSTSPARFQMWQCLSMWLGVKNGQAYLEFNNKPF